MMYITVLMAVLILMVATHARVLLGMSYLLMTEHVVVSKEKCKQLVISVVMYP